MIGPLILSLLAVAPVSSGGQEAPATTAAVHGLVRSGEGGGVVGARVRIVNSPVAAGAYEAVTDEEGRFDLGAVALTEQFSMRVEAGVAYMPFTLERLAPSYFGPEGAEIWLDDNYVDIRGSVLVVAAGRRAPQPDALVATPATRDGAISTTSGQDGRFALLQLPLRMFPDAARGRVLVVLPARAGLAGGFEPAPFIAVEFDVKPGMIDVGEVIFSARDVPPGEVRLGGTLLRRSSIDGAEEAVAGLIIQAVSPATGSLVAQTTTATDGSWMLSLPAAEYSFRFANAGALGLRPPPPTRWVIHQDRTGLRQVIEAGSQAPSPVAPGGGGR